MCTKLGLHGCHRLLQFALQPRSIFLADFSGDSKVWESPVVSQVAGLSDFGLILLISATPDSARAWIEQDIMDAGDRIIAALDHEKRG